MKDLRKYLVELLGTFFLTLVVSLTGNPFAVGAVLATLVYAGGYISGGYFNPAVTLAVLIRGKISRTDAVRYTVSQIIGASLAAIFVVVLVGTGYAVAPAPQATMLQVYLSEVLFTFFLASTVLHVATSKETKGNQYFGAAIGLSLMVGVFTVGSISGGIFNPAIALGTILVDYPTLSTNMPNLIIYLTATLTGGLLAGLAYRYLTGSKK